LLDAGWKAFVAMSSDPANVATFHLRTAGLEAQYLIPMRPGWYSLDRAPPPPTARVGQFDASNVWVTPSGLVGGTAEGSRVGETASSEAQAVGFCADERLGAGKVWHLNMLKFQPDQGRESYVHI